MESMHKHPLKQLKLARLFKLYTRNLSSLQIVHPVGPSWTSLLCKIKLSFVFDNTSVVITKETFVVTSLLALRSNFSMITNYNT